MNRFPFSDLDECVELYRELIRCLKEEHEQLIYFKIESLGDITFKKGALGKALSFKHRKLKERLMLEFGTDEPKFNNPEDQSLWDASKAKWVESWEEATRLCKYNQEFLQHSLKNIDALADHLRRLLGENLTYSSQGKRVEGRSEGKVIEARY